ncbi:MAG: transglycosylase family protein [Nitriliruptoraceae bacterium]
MHVFLVPEHWNTVQRLSSTFTRIVGITFSLVLVATLVAPVAQADTAPTFADIDSERVQAAADALASNNIVQGCDTNAFCPEDPLRRDQFATILINARTWLAGQTDDLQDAGVTPTILPMFDMSAVPFRDVAFNVHFNSIAMLALDGVTSGCEEGLYCPADLVMRGQLATLLAELFDLPETDESYFDDLQGHAHINGVNRLAAAGIVLECETSLVAFCASSPVSRADVAVYVARAMNLLPRVSLAPLEERRAAQAELDAAQAERDAAQAQRDAARSERAAIWDALAQCESHGEWSYGPHSTWGSRLYHGGLQFHPNTWSSYRDDTMPRYAFEATREQQIVVAERVLERQGWGAWPSCSSALGLR